MTIFEKNPDGSFKYQTGDGFYCEHVIDTVEHPELVNCAVGTTSIIYGNQCDKCADGYSLNILFDQN
jgi:methionyl-tRNA synthetase